MEAPREIIVRESHVCSVEIRPCQPGSRSTTLSEPVSTNGIADLSCRIGSEADAIYSWMVRYILKRHIPQPSRILLVESGSRSITETAIPRIRMQFHDAAIDLVTCFF